MAVCRKRNGTIESTSANARKGVEQSNSDGTPKPVETSFRAFSDGTIFDLVRRPEPGAELQLLRWSKRRAKIRPAFDKNGELLVPPSVDAQLVSAIQFPPGISPDTYFSDVDDLLAEITTAAHMYVEAPSQDLYLLAAFVISSWFVDRFTHAPYLSVVGPLGSGKTQLLQFLSSCCRRAFLVDDISPAGLYSLSHQFQPTLLMDEADFGRDGRSRELQKLLRAGHTAGGFILRAHRPYTLYGSKVIASREPIPDAALASRCVQISMARSTRNVKSFEPGRIAWLANILQPKLLSFRLRNYHAKFEVHADLGGLSPRSRDLARALAGPLEQNIDVQKFIVHLIKQREPDVQARHEDENELQVLEALFSVCHPPHLPYVTVGTISACLNKLLEERGERRRFEPRKVGPILRQLGFQTIKLGSMGIGFVVSKHVLEHLHKQVDAYAMSVRLYPHLCKMCSGLECQQKDRVSTLLTS